MHRHTLSHTYSAYAHTHMRTQSHGTCTPTHAHAQYSHTHTHTHVANFHTLSHTQTHTELSWDLRGWTQNYSKDSRTDSLTVDGCGAGQEPIHSVSMIVVSMSTTTLGARYHVSHTGCSLGGKCFALCCCQNFALANRKCTLAIGSNEHLNAALLL